MIFLYPFLRKAFNSRPPRGGRRPGFPLGRAWYRLSIHDLQEEVDNLQIACTFSVISFQFTTSKRRSTRCRPEAGHANGLSIHDLQEEVDDDQQENEVV